MKRIPGINGEIHRSMQKLDKGVKVEQPRMQWLGIGEDKINENMLEGYTDFIKNNLVGIDESYLAENDIMESSIDPVKELSVQEKEQYGVVIGMVPIHTNNWEDIDYTFVIKKNGSSLFYLEEQNPLNSDKDYWLSVIFIMKTSKDIQVNYCIRQK